MDLNTLIAECTAYDYKEMLEENKPKSWLKSISAFSNGLGGSLFYGVDNSGVVKGLDDVPHVCEAISSKLRDYMDPLPDVEMIPHEVEGHHILQVKVNVGKYTPYYYVKDGQRIAFVRNGEESIPATAEDMVRLVLKGSNKTYDSLLTDNKTEDNSFAILANTFKERTGQDWDKKYLLSFGLVTKDGHLTNAGALFADDCSLSQSRLYCTRWSGLEKDDAINDAEYKGNVLLLLREAMNFVKSNTKKGWEKLPDGRRNKPEYAERAVLEALVNHFIHRDYTVMGGEVHLDIYDNRIAITSPGGMYSGQKVQDLTIEEISSERRNPILADVMAQLDLMEKRGSGLKRIVNETKALDGYNDELKPVFRSTTSQFMTTIFSTQYGENGQIGTKSGLSWEQVGSKLGVSWDEVEKLIGALQHPMLLSDLKELYGWKNASKFKRKYINPLMAEGLADMTVPNKPTSPNQKYYLTEKGKVLLANELGVKRVEDVSGERVNRLITEFAEALPRFEVNLPAMEKQYEDTLPIAYARLFQANYKMNKEMFVDNGTWVYNTPELYLTEIQANIWQQYNAQFVMHRADVSYQIRFSEIKTALKALGIDGNYAVITSFFLDMFDARYGGETALKETNYGYQFGEVPIYRVPSHEDHLIVIRKDLLPRCEPKAYEGPSKEYRLINEQHLLYSNIYNMKDEGDGLGLVMMRDIKFYSPEDKDFHYVKLMVDRMERRESDLDKIMKI